MKKIVLGALLLALVVLHGCVYHGGVSGFVDGGFLSADFFVPVPYFYGYPHPRPHRYYHHRPYYYPPQDYYLYPEEPPEYWPEEEVALHSPKYGW